MKQKKKKPTIDVDAKEHQRVQNFSRDYWPMYDHTFICTDLNRHSTA